MPIKPVSLRQRMILGTGLMLIPLILLGGVGYAFYQHTLDAFESVMQRNLQVVLPVSDLQRRIQQMDKPLAQYLFNGREQERELFYRQSQVIDTRFDKLIGNDEPLLEYRNEISRAKQSWQQLQALGGAIMNRPLGVENEAIDMLLRFETRQRQTSQLMGQLYRSFDSAMQRNYQEALQDRRQIHLLLLLTGITGVSIAIFVGNRLAYRMLVPLGKLREGTERFGNGDLTHRIQLESKDEFRLLADTFNKMADELEFLAVYDSLTGLLNKREFELRLNDEVRRARRVRHPFVLLLLDLDYFKQINDTHGHPAGDQALRALAILLKKQVREADYIGRYGGEEFGIILTNTSEQEGYETAERIRKQVAGKRFSINEIASIRMTLSTGLACYPDDAANADVLITCADEALYKAKETGRNRVVSFSDI